MWEFHTDLMKEKFSQIDNKAVKEEGLDCCKRSGFSCVLTHLSFSELLWLNRLLRPFVRRQPNDRSGIRFLCGLKVKHVLLQDVSGTTPDGSGKCRCAAHRTLLLTVKSM